MQIIKSSYEKLDVGTEFKVETLWCINSSEMAVPVF